MPPPDEITLVGLDRLTLDEGVQSRAALSSAAVLEYRDWLADPDHPGRDLPPVDVFFDGVTRWVADGFHRVHGYRLASRKAIPCRVREGTRRDAVLFAAGSNQGHALPRTRADKRRVVGALLDDLEWRQWSPQAVADHCGVSRSLVYLVLRERELAAAARREEEDAAEAEGWEEESEEAEEESGEEGAAPGEAGAAVQALDEQGKPAGRSVDCVKERFEDDDRAKLRAQVGRATKKLRRLIDRAAAAGLEGVAEILTHHRLQEVGG